MNFVSGDNLCSMCSPPHSPPSPSSHPSAVEWSGLSTTEPQPITWEPQLPASHQIKWISNWVKAPSLGQAEWRTGRLLLLFYLSWLSVYYLFFFFYLLLCSAPVLLFLSPFPSLCPSDLLAGATWNEKRLVVKAQIPMRYLGGSVM